MNRKVLTFPILLSIVVGNMIGTGIYILPASLAEFGTISILAWLITSTGALLLALTFIRLNKRFPETGGPYAFCKEAFGKLVGFIIAYTYWISNLVSIAGIAVSSVGYLGFITPTLDANSKTFDQTYALFFELGAVWLFTFINIVGLQTAGLIQLCLTIIKIIPLVLIVLLGFAFIHIDNLTQWSVSNTSQFSALSSAAALTFWAFIGLESATVPAENTPGAKVVAKATLYGTVLTSTIYILSTIVLMGMISVTHLQHSQFPFADAANMIFGHHPAAVLAICAVISGLGALNVCILIQGQIVFAAARDHLFPKIFAKLSKNDVPFAGQLLSSCLVSLLLTLTIKPSLLEQFNHIALLAAFLTLTTYLVSMLAELKFLLTAKEPLTKILFSKSTLITTLAACYILWMVASLNTTIVLIGISAILCCIPIYILIVRKYVH